LFGNNRNNAGDTDALVKLLTDAHLNIAYWAATLLGRRYDLARHCAVVRDVICNGLQIFSVPVGTPLNQRLTIRYRLK
jgi:hypothetical protein